MKARLLEHYNGGVPGDVVEIDGGRASVLALRGILAILAEPGVPPVAMEIDSGGYALPEAKPEEKAAVIVSYEQLAALAEERGFVIAPEDAVDRLVEIFEADEGTGLLAAAEQYLERVREEQTLALVALSAAQVEVQKTAQERDEIQARLDEANEKLSAPAPEFGLAEVEAYALAHNLRIETAENLQALLRQAHEPLPELDLPALAEAQGLVLVSQAELDELKRLATDGKTKGEKAAAAKK